MLYLIVITDVVTTFAMKNSIGQISHKAIVMLTSVLIVSVLILSYYPASAGVCKISCLVNLTGNNTTNDGGLNVTNTNNTHIGKVGFNSTIKNVPVTSPGSVSKVIYNTTTPQHSNIITTSLPLSSNNNILPHFTNATLNGSSASQNNLTSNGTSNQSLATLYNNDPNNENSNDNSNGRHNIDHNDDSNDNSHSSDSSGGNDNHNHKSHNNNNDKLDKHLEKNKHHTRDNHNEDGAGDNGKPGKSGYSGKDGDNGPITVHGNHFKLKGGLIQHILQHLSP
jgi:hypothetical protein